MKRTLCAFLFSVVFGAAMPQPRAMEMVKTINNDREYLLIMPSGATEASPIMIAYHDSEFPLERFKLHSRLEQYAENANFILVLPVMRGERWQDGTYGSGRNVMNDIVFTNAILDRLTAEYGLGKGRIYAAGMGPGGFMAQSYACYGKYKLSGIGVVAAALDKDVAAHCNIPPLDVVFAHGSEDRFFTRAGWMYKNSPYYSTIESVDFWIKHNGCTTKNVEKVPSQDAKDITSVTRMTFGGCAKGAQVTFYDIMGGGHTWPGSYKREKPDYGRVTNAINMSGILTNMTAQ